MNRARPEPKPLRQSGTTREERAIADLVGRLPDASPDELQVARVWRRLHAPERGPSSAWRWAAASVLALTLVVGAGRLWMVLSPTHAEVLATEGGVFSGGAGAAWVPVRRGDPIPTDTLVRSDGSGHSLLSVSGIAALVLGADADLTIDRLGRSTVLQLERGRVTARVTKRPAGSSFVVRAGGFTVTVVGTLFSVTETVDGRVAVSVREGVVEVAGRGQTWRVGAGQRWSSDTPDRLAGSDLSAASDELLRHAMDAPASPEIPGLFNDLVHAEAVSTAIDTGGVIPSGQRGTSLAPLGPTPTPTASPKNNAHPNPVRRPEALARLEVPAQTSVVPPVVLAPTPAAAPTAPPTATPPPPPTPTAVPTAAPTRDFYAEALNLARHGQHHEAAIVLERALAAGEGPRDLELYQLASLRQRHLGDPQGALEVLLAYQQQYPSGALRQEVSLSIVEADLALGREEAALAESAHFLARYPANERADELRLLRGDLLRQHGDCAKALTEYRSVGGGEALDDALYYAAYCRRELGDGPGAAKALQEYLSRFPSGKHAAPARQALGQ
jgi:TolA-binding protein